VQNHATPFHFAPERVHESHFIPLCNTPRQHLAIADTKRGHSEVRARAGALHKAAECYTAALANDDTNLYAAQGLGCLHAKNGRFALAKEAMLLVRDAAAAVGDSDRSVDSSSREHYFVCSLLCSLLLCCWCATRPQPKATVTLLTRDKFTF
jgi:hypothetical protein